MGRPKQWAGTIILKVADGFRERIDAVLKPGEDRSGFIRTAAEAEIKRRSRTKG